VLALRRVLINCPREPAQGEGEILILAAIIGLSATAFAQTAPKVSGKPLKQAKPIAPMACKLVGTVKGTKLWAGDCLSPPELRDTSPMAEPAAPGPTPEANPPSANNSCQAPRGGSARLVPEPAADGIAPRCGSVLEHQLIQGHQSGIAELCKVRREYPVVVGYELFHVGLEARNQ
jgi:hypothetical protein